MSELIDEFVELLGRVIYYQNGGGGGRVHLARGGVGNFWQSTGVGAQNIYIVLAIY